MNYKDKIGLVYSNTSERKLCKCRIQIEAYYPTWLEDGINEVKEHFYLCNIDICKLCAKSNFKQKDSFSSNTIFSAKDLIEGEKEGHLKLDPISYIKKLKASNE